MKLQIDAHMVYRLRNPCPLLLQIEAAESPGQAVLQEQLTIDPQTPLNRIADTASVGDRIWLEAAGDFRCDYSALVDVTRPAAQLAGLEKTSLTDVSGHVVKYLMPSRYCHPERFFDFTAKTFAGTSGGTRIAAMVDWIQNNIRYDIYASDPSTCAHDSFDARAGVCRDFAHIFIAMARAVSIPARFVSCYGAHVSPQDFHAVAEIYLDGDWHLVDPTGMAQAPNIVRIGAGRDAADTSFLTSYGWVDLVEQSVNVTEN